MVAYNFRKRFVKPIEDGTKKQTIRRVGKRRHVRPGEKIQVYFAQRTQHCRKILEDDPSCLAVFDLEVVLGDDGFESIKVQGQEIPPEQFDEFAQKDGFADAADMFNYWLEESTPRNFKGLLIEWE